MSKQWGWVYIRGHGACIPEGLDTREGRELIYQRAEGIPEGRGIPEGVGVGIPLDMGPGIPTPSTDT